MTAKIKYNDVKEGDVLIADAGFTCMAAGPKTVVKDEQGFLYVPCDSEGGRHYLDGQRSWPEDVLIGLTREAP